MERLEPSASSTFPKKLLLNEDAALGPGLVDDDLEELRLPLAKEFSERPVAQIDPCEGFCVKCRYEDPTAAQKNAKVFVNLMYDDALPPPGEPLASVSDQGLAELLEAGTTEINETLRIPMSLGGPRVEKDKSGEECRVCDVVINSAFYRKADASLIMKTFLVTVTLDGLEQKYDIPLNRDNWVILKNKKYFGTKAGHFVRDTPVKELDEPVVEVLRAPAAGGEHLLKESSTTRNAEKPSGKAAPNYEFRREPGGFLRARFELPDAVRGGDVDLQMNDDRLVLSSPKHHLDIFLPVRMIFDECDAEFDSKSRVLTARIPLKAS